MAFDFSLKSLVSGNALAYIAPALVVGSLFHIFSPIPAKHQFGQLEIIGAFIAVGYYLWSHIAYTYAPHLIGKKRLELVACATGGIFSALLLLPPLLTWQSVALYKASEEKWFYSKPLISIVLTVWIGLCVFYYGSYHYKLGQMNAQINTQITPPATPENSGIVPTKEN